MGQLDCMNNLNGIGKKIHPWVIIEGQFKDNKLQGFGRHIDRDGEYAIGFFIENDMFKGFGHRKVGGREEEGHWDGAYFKWGD